MRTASRNEDSVSKILDKCPGFNSYMIAEKDKSMLKNNYSHLMRKKDYNIQSN